MLLQEQAAESSRHGEPLSQSRKQRELDMTSRYLNTFSNAVVALITVGLAMFFPASILLEISGFLPLA